MRLAVDQTLRKPDNGQEPVTRNGPATEKDRQVVTGGMVPLNWSLGGDSNS
jgi:hypothetical protein